MELQVRFILSQSRLPKDYLPIFYSFLKQALEKNNKEKYAELFGKGDAKPKNYSFYIKLSHPVFEGDFISLDNSLVTMSIRGNDKVELLEFYNAFLNDFNEKKVYPMNLNSSKIQTIKMKPLKMVDSTTIFIKMCSPLVVKKHVKDGNKSYYFTYQDEEFSTILKENISNISKRLGYEFDLTSFEIIPVNPRKTVITIYGISIPCSIGSFVLKGSKELLDMLYHGGIGSLKSSGCGVFEIIGEE